MGVFSASLPPPPVPPSPPSDYINNMTSAEKECLSAPVFSIKAPQAPRVVWQAERRGAAFGIVALLETQSA